MTKKQAEEILHQKIEEMNSKTEAAKDSDEYIRIVDGILKVYTILCEADGFDKEKPTGSTANLGS